MEQKTDFYVYQHRRVSDGVPFYIGKGRNYRAWQTARRNQYWQNTANKHGFSVEIVASGLTEEQAFDMERTLIAHQRLWGDERSVTNLSDGGEGSCGVVRSAETRAKLAEQKIGAKNPNFGKRGSLSPNYGRPLSLERRQLISLRLSGDNHPNWGRELPEETKRKLSKALTGKPFSEEHRRNISRSTLGRFRGEESPHYKPELIEFEHIATGDRVLLTRCQARDRLPLRAQEVTNLISGYAKTAKGYRVIKG